MTGRVPTRAGCVFGFGLGGMVDGILLHQVLRWHHVASGEIGTDTVDGLEHNTFVDGLFHLATLAVVVVGAVLLWRAALRPAEGWNRLAVGGVLVGVGTFHLVDEVVFHLLLELHHIRMVENYLVYDLGYTAIGLVLIAAGWAVLRSAPGRVPDRP